MGVLTDFYQLADFVFVGGTLVDIGGHSILEPLYYGKKPIIGEYFQNIEEIVKDAKELGFVEIVKNKDEIIEYLKKSENIDTREFFEKNNEIDKILNEIYQLNCKKYNNYKNKSLRKAIRKWKIIIKLKLLEKMDKK